MTLKCNWAVIFLIRDYGKTKIEEYIVCINFSIIICNLVQPLLSLFGVLAAPSGGRRFFNPHSVEIMFCLGFINRFRSHTRDFFPLIQHMFQAILQYVYQLIDHLSLNQLNLFHLEPKL